MRTRSRVFRFLLYAACLFIAASGLVTVLKFPYDMDSAEDVSGASELTRYYKDAYQSPPTSDVAVRSESAEESLYTKMAREAAIGQGIPEQVRAFVGACDLKNKRVLEVGAGSGLLQDAVADYTALDISPTARQFFHKPFVRGSATARPFPDNAFDAVWSIWVLEHIPNPERALAEMRRVVKNNGYILLRPAWNCPAWAAEGYEFRPYSDFGWKGKLIKASIPVQRSRWSQRLWLRQVRLLRWISYRSGGPTRLRFRRLTPNYVKYWGPDSDAAISIDSYEALIWFTSRGDICRNCPDPTRLVTRFGLSVPDGLIIQVRKPG